MHLSLLFTLFSTPLFALAGPLAIKPRTSITLSKKATFTNDDGYVNIEALKAHISVATSKVVRGFGNYKKNTGQRHPNHSTNVTARAVGDVALTDDNQILWQGSLTVGTPPVAYTVDFDTGSSDLFLPSNNCDATCNGHTPYNAAASSTSKALGKSFSLSFGDGSTVTGNQFQDTVKIGGLTAKTQTLGAALQYSAGFESTQFAPDGLMGMAFQSISQYNAPPVFQTLVANNQATAGVFAMKLTQTGAEMTLGGVDNSLISGQITNVPVTQQGFWQIQFDALAANGQNVVGTTPCIVDSGTTLVIGDQRSVTAFYSQIPGAQDASATLGSGFFTFPCNSNPTATFTLGGAKFSMTKSLNMGQASRGSNQCVGSIIASSIGDSFWILGDAFMTNVLTVFDLDNSQVGFANLA